MLRNIFIDMDNTIADFNRSPLFGGIKKDWNPPEMYERGFFETLPPMEGALTGVRELIEYSKKNGIVVHILSKPVSITWYSYSEKVIWINKWFPELTRNIILCQNKELLSGLGNVLIDDQVSWKEPWERAGGKFILFDEPKSSLSYWIEIVCELQRPTPL